MNKPLDSVVTAFIAILICVFDPLAVCLILAFNVATRGSVLKEDNPEPELLIETPTEEEKPAKPILSGIKATARMTQK